MDELPDAIDDEADAIMDDIRLNAARVSEVAEMIEGERRSRTLWVFGLDGVSVALAISLAALALKTLSRQEAMVRRRQEELEGFAGRVAHDLLNPISAAEMSLAAAERGAAGNDRMTALSARGRRSLKRARSLVDDLFAFAQAGARPAPGRQHRGRRDRRRRRRGAAPARGRAWHRHRGRAAAGAARRALRERRAGEPAVQSAAQRDQAHGQQQAPAGRIRITARHERVRFEVEDTGPGLPPELVPQAFDPYVRGAGTSEPGLGLGLATVRRLAEGHDGRYGVSSRPGEGALFWFELPAADEPPPREIPPLPRPPAAAARKLGGRRES